MICGMKMAKQNAVYSTHLQAMKGDWATNHRSSIRTIQTGDLANSSLKGTPLFHLLCKGILAVALLALHLSPAQAMRRSTRTSAHFHGPGIVNGTMAQGPLPTGRAVRRHTGTGVGHGLHWQRSVPIARGEARTLKVKISKECLDKLISEVQEELKLRTKETDAGAADMGAADAQAVARPAPARGIRGEFSSRFVPYKQAGETEGGRAPKTAEHADPLADAHLPVSLKYFLGGRLATTHRSAPQRGMPLATIVEGDSEELALTTGSSATPHREGAAILFEAAPAAPVELDLKTLLPAGAFQPYARAASDREAAGPVLFGRLYRTLSKTQQQKIFQLLNVIEPAFNHNFMQQHPWAPYLAFYVPELLLPSMFRIDVGQGEHPTVYYNFYGDHPSRPLTECALREIYGGEGAIPSGALLEKVVEGLENFGIPFERIKDGGGREDREIRVKSSQARSLFRHRFRDNISVLKALARSAQKALDAKDVYAGFFTTTRLYQNLTHAFGASIDITYWLKRLSPQEIKRLDRIFAGPLKEEVVQLFRAYAGPRNRLSGLVQLSQLSEAALAHIRISPFVETAQEAFPLQSRASLKQILSMHRALARLDPYAALVLFPKGRQKEGLAAFDAGMRNQIIHLCDSIKRHFFWGETPYAQLRMVRALGKLAPHVQRKILLAAPFMMQPSYSLHQRLRLIKNGTVFPARYFKGVVDLYAQATRWLLVPPAVSIRPALSLLSGGAFQTIPRPVRRVSADALALVPYEAGGDRAQSSTE